MLTGESLTEQHGGPYGNPYRDKCPQDQVLIGYFGSVREVYANPTRLISSLQAVCGALAVSSDVVHVSPAGALPVRGTPGDVATWLQMCPDDHAIVGFEGRAGLALDRVAFVCGRWEVSSPDAGKALFVTSTTTFLSAGGDGGMAFQNRCPAGQVARGHSLRAGTWVDALALVCSTPTWVPRP